MPLKSSGGGAKVPFLCCLFIKFFHIFLYVKVQYQDCSMAQLLLTGCQFKMKETLQECGRHTIEPTHMDYVKIKAVGKEFVQKNEERINYFGSFPK